MSKDITDELIIREDTSGYSFEKSKGNMDEDIKKLIEELTNVRPDELSKEGLKLFNKINEIIDKNKELEEYYKEQNEVNAKFIPVSLVEEKIEEYQNNMKLYENETHNIFNENNVRQEVITVLQELLEKR